MCSSVVFGCLFVHSFLHICSAVIGDDCKYDRCIGGEVNAYCLKNKCSCHEGKAISDNELKCLQAASNVGESCEEEVQCTHALTEWAYCTESKQCACREGAHFTNGQCEKIKSLGDSCESPNECSHILNADCNTTDATCACTRRYVPSPNKSACLPSAETILDPCELDLQCQSLGDNATCLNSQCKCKEAYHFSGTPRKMCIHSRGVGDSCEIESGDCYSPRDGIDQNIECRAGTCVCKNGSTHIIGHNSCKTTASNVGESCEEEVQCTHALTEWAYCTESKQCACREGAHFTNGQCEKIKFSGSSSGVESGNNSWVWFLIAAVCAAIQLSLV